jgi:Protein of unknown function (DUF3631)
MPLKILTMKTETVIFDTIIPHDVPVNIAELLTNIEAVIKKHVILADHAAAALAVWVLHTYTFEMRDTVAYVAIESPEKRCGKTTLLSVLAAMACKPLIASNITVGALFRSVHTCSPTLFIDEADTFMAGNGTMRGIINSGNTRRTAYVLRLSAGRKPSPHPDPLPSHRMGAERGQQSAESTDSGLKKYSCWCPKVIAMIGEVPDTIADRSIVVKMARKLTTEACVPLAQLDTAEIKAKCARFALDMGQGIGSSPKIRCDGLNDRAADTFDPLFVIAHLASEDWETKLRAAALSLSSTADTENSGSGLIMDIIDIFVDTGREKIFTRDLIPLLRDGGLKSQVLQPVNITEYQISKILRRYGIKPISVRIGKEVKNGYHAIDFREAVRRYVSYADREANLKAAHQRWQLQREAAEEAAKQQALFEKFKAVIPMDETLSDSELKELALKIKREQEMVETIAGHAEQPASQY